MKLVLFCMMISFLLSGCTPTEPEEVPQTETVAPTISMEQNTFKEEKKFGTYEVSDNWVFLENYSGEESAYYAKNGEEITNQTSYIAVEYRQNQYTKEEYDTLVSAILYQLKLELKEELYHNLITESFTSKNGYSVFRVESNDQQNEVDVKTTQYYIAGEKAHVLVQVTNFGQENIEEIAKNIVESFVWREITI